jgi:hypothetical protein
MKHLIAFSINITAAVIMLFIIKANPFFSGYITCMAGMIYLNYVDDKKNKKQ